jgi:ribose 1,5-bisphosphokinase
MTMNGRLLYVVGPSGSGKDTLIETARRTLPDDVDVKVARRTITRPVGHGAEQHLAVSEYRFELLAAAGEFALHWQANGLRYGIGRELLRWLKDGTTVVVNGSRLHIGEALAIFPDVEVVHVTASPQACRERMAIRARDDAAQVEERLARARDWQPPAGVRVVELANQSTPAVAAHALQQLLVRGFGAWTPELTDRTRPAPPERSAARPRAPSPRRARRTTAAGSSPGSGR